MKLSSIALATMGAGLVLCGTLFAACVGDSPGASSDTSPPIPEAGAGADADSSTSDAEVADTSVPDSGCGNTMTDPMNCGSCGHKCVGADAGAPGCFSGTCGNVVTQIAGSPSASFTCAVTAAGTVYCWGDNGFGQLGIGSKTKTYSNSAVLAAADSTQAVFDHVVEVGVGFDHACARKNDGSIWCWGQATYGATGVSIGSPDAVAPTRVGSLIGFKKIAVGGATTCGIDATGSVVCWGTNDHLSLGHAFDSPNDVSCGGSACNGPGTVATGQCNPIPAAVAGISGATSLWVSDQGGCAVDGAGAVKCWGADDFGQLGDTTTTPCGKGVVTVGVLGSPLALGGSRNEGCAVYGGNSQAKCWGRSASGQLGVVNASTTMLAPLSYGGGVNALAASGGYYHLCVVLTTGRVVCTGLNDHNALGNGNASTTVPITTPVNVLLGSNSMPIDNVTQLASGYLQTCALRQDGTVWCWGDNTAAGELNGTGGRLGIGSSTAQIGAAQVVGLP